MTPDYFEAMRIPVILGRTFDDQDAAGRTRVVILSRTAAQQYFPNDRSPIGNDLQIEDGPRAAWRVIGVVGDVRNLRPDLPPCPLIYVPMAQSPAGTMTLVIRTERDPSALTGAVRLTVQSADPEQAVTDVKTMAEIMNGASARWRVSTSLFLCFGISALALAVVGVYSVAAYNVAQRTREIAIRVALGSSRAEIMRLILQPLGLTSGIGTCIGLLLAAAVNHGLRSLLYGTEPVDPRVCASCAGGFLILTLSAAAAAAAKAARIEPGIALKAE